MEPPPTVLPPQAPPPKNHLRGCIVIAAILSLLGLVVAGVGVWAYFNLERIAREDPKPFPGFGKPEPISRGRDGWVTYRFSDIGCVMALPAKPKTGKVQWDSRGRVGTEQFAYYSFESKKTGIEIETYKTRLGLGASNKEFAEYKLQQFRWDERLLDVDGEITPFPFGGQSGLKLTLTYRSEGERVVTEGYFAKPGGKEFAIQFHYWSDEAKAARKEIDRVLGSLAFR